MSYLKGLKDGSPIGLGYFAVSFSFGIAGSKIFSWPLVTLISMTNLTSAGQFAGLQIMADAAGTFIEMALATFFINLRYSLMAISLSQKVSPDFGTVKRLLLATGITDEIFAVAMSQKRVTPIYFLGLSTLPYIGWSLGTMVGAICGEILPAIVTNALGVALYGMFVAIVVPQMKVHGPTVFAVVIAVALSCAFKFFPPLSGVSVGFAIIICALVASFVAAWFFPMANVGVTLFLRAVPFILLRKKLKSVFWSSFLAYVPYTVLSAMTVPAIFFATDSRLTGACALLAAVVASLLGGGLVTVAAVSCLAVLGVDGLMLL